MTTYYAVIRNGFSLAKGYTPGADGLAAHQVADLLDEKFGQIGIIVAVGAKAQAEAVTND